MIRTLWVIREALFLFLSISLHYQNMYNKRDIKNFKYYTYCNSKTTNKRENICRIRRDTCLVECIKMKSRHYSVIIILFMSGFYFFYMGNFLHKDSTQLIIGENVEIVGKKRRYEANQGSICKGKFWLKF